MKDARIRFAAVVSADSSPVVLVVPAAIVSYVLIVLTVNVGRDLWSFRTELSWLWSLEKAPYDFRTSWLAPVAIRLEQFGDHRWAALFGILMFLVCMAVLWIVLWFYDVSRGRRNLSSPPPPSSRSSTCFCST